jgi:hypothetical protein
VCLHGRDKAQLLANSEGILHGLSLILRVVAVRCARCAEDGREHRRVVPEDLANSAGNSDVPLASKIIHEARPQCSRVWEQENIVLLRRGGRVVVEVIDHQGALVVGDANIELEEERLDGGRSSLLA